MLAIQKHIIEHGLDATIEKFKLDFKDYPHKVLLKYKQIESPMSMPEVQDARGLVLRKSDWSVLSLAFRKFFNVGEGNGEPLDWSTARIYEKLDGTLVHVYSDGDNICFGTTGTAEGEGSVDNFHWSPDGATERSFGTFADLFWKAFLETNQAVVPDGIVYESRRQAFAWWSGYTLAFELCTPYNIVVTPHADFRVYLLGARKLDTMEEVGFDDLNKMAEALGVLRPRTFDVNDVDELMVMVAKQPFSMEGVVACDANFNRRKLKNPAYVSVHYMREATAYWRIVDVVRSGEMDEYLAYFPGRKEEVSDIETKWKSLISKMEEMAADVKPHADKVRASDPESPESRLARKDAAMFISKEAKQRGLTPFQAYFFNMLGGTKAVRSPELRTANLYDYLLLYDGREMYAQLKKWKAE